MKKIPTIFVRDLSKQPALVTPQWHPDCLWVRDGEGIATRKYDGTSCESMPDRALSDPDRLERLAIMLECHPDVSLAEIEHAAACYRAGKMEEAKTLARLEQDAGRDGRQVMRAVQWAASSVGGN